jgi:hypothetical protein
MMMKCEKGVKGENRQEERRFFFLWCVGKRRQLVVKFFFPQCPVEGPVMSKGGHMQFGLIIWKVTMRH